LPDICFDFQFAEMVADNLLTKTFKWQTIGPWNHPWLFCLVLRSFLAAGCGYRLFPCLYCSQTPANFEGFFVLIPWGCVNIFLTRTQKKNFLLSLIENGYSFKRKYNDGMIFNVF